MNLFKKYTKDFKYIISKNKNSLNLNNNLNFDNIIVESPPEQFDYDLSSNAAMVLSKINNENPRSIAEKLKLILSNNINDFTKIDIAGPGFLNFKFNKKTWVSIINSILKSKTKYGSNKIKKKYNVEFVSANPTGPMHVGHCRGAVFGDVISNLLKFNGAKVTKEFYINDYGKQIENFTKSVFLRMREIKFKENFPNNNDLYHGDYIIDIAKILFENSKKINLNKYEDSFNTIKNSSLQQSLKLIKSDLKLLGIKHDVFFSESSMIKKKYVDKIINILKKNNHVTDGYLSPPKGEEINSWKKTKRLIFKSSNFGDDSDRALQKNDGTWTYFANDIGYHFTKVSKKYDKLINVLGADHIGYIKRITAAVTAISNNKTNLTCKVCQLVKFMKNGQPFKMSKRSGDFFPLSKLLSEVNKDAIRFMMLYRSNDVEIEFDFNKILEKNKENPVFYVQYCYARINSIFNTLNINPNKKINYNFNEFKLNTFEEKILRKIIEWPKVVDTSSDKLEPHRITFYLYQLSTIFHSYWSKGNEDKNLKFINNGKINNLFTLKLFQLISIILENGMFILGVSLPKKM